MEIILLLLMILVLFGMVIHKNISEHRKAKARWEMLLEEDFKGELEIIEMMELMSRPYIRFRMSSDEDGAAIVTLSSSRNWKDMGHISYAYSPITSTWTMRYYV